MPLDRFGSQKLDPLARPFQFRMRAGRRRQAVDLISNRVRVGRPVDRRLALFDLARVDDAIGGLGVETQLSAREFVPAFRQQARAMRGQRADQIAGRVFGADPNARLAGHRTRVETFLHLHQADAGFGIARHDRALDRRGAAPTRQQRPVQVDAAEPRRGENREGQDQAIGGDDGGVHGEIREVFLRVGVSQGSGRQDPQSQRLRFRVHRRPGEFQTAATRGPRRLRVDRRYIRAQRDQRLQRGNSELRGAHEDDSHAAALTTALEMSSK
jgi:hypothetical protein